MEDIKALRFIGDNGVNTPIARPHWYLIHIIQKYYKYHHGKGNPIDNEDDWLQLTYETYDDFHLSPAYMSDAIQTASTPISGMSSSTPCPCDPLADFRKGI